MYKENYYEKEIIKNTNATCFSYYLYIFIVNKTASAESISTEIPSSITYYDDGSYDIETCYPETMEHNFLLSTASATETKSHFKKIKHYDNNNNVCWTYTLTAYFTVNKGVSVKYKSCTGSLKIINNKYSFYSEKHGGSNNKCNWYNSNKI